MTTRAIDRIALVADELSSAPPSSFPPDLAQGAAGVALFFAYRYLATGSEADAGRAMGFLESALEAATAERDIGLYRRRLGVAWVLAHLSGVLVDVEGNDPNDRMDAAVLSVLDGPVPFYDLMSGLVGLGVYALERLPRPIAAETLERVLGELARRGQRDGDGLTWFHPPDQLPDVFRRRAPRGCWQLGVPQGVAGVIGFLGQVRTAGVAVRQADELLGPATAWVLAHANPPGSASIFDAWVDPLGRPEPGSGTWASGDPGVAAALYTAGHTADALAVARTVAARPVYADRADLCHGAAGVSHILRRLHRASGDPALGEAADGWLNAALDLPVPESGFLEGSAGVGLALLAATSDAEPAWDRILLLPGADVEGSPAPGEGHRRPEGEGAGASTT